METHYFGLGEIPPKLSGDALCLGTFDGVHRGHQALALRAREASAGKPAILLFDKSPADVIGNGKSHAILTTLEDKLRRFASLGVEEACVIRIDKDFFALSPESFIEKVLKPLDPALLVVGEDYSFGAGGRGRIADLRKAFPVEVVPLLKDGKAKISTQLIIRDLRSGRLEKANRALGYPYEIHGIVGHGLQNGRKLGFPTANLVLRDPYVLPKDGVYFGLSYVRGFPYRSLINVGRNPTIGGLTHSLVESYMEGFEGEIYGETLYVAFLRYLRPEVRFPSFDELKAQIEKDKKALRESAKGDC